MYKSLSYFYNILYACHHIFSCQGVQCTRVLRGSVVKCLTRNTGILGSRRTGSSEFFCGSVLGQDTSEPQPSTGETQERHE